MLTITTERIPTGFDGSTGFCYVHARSGIGPDNRMLMTCQKLRMKGCDAFQGLEMLERKPGGDWSGIRACPGLVRRSLDKNTDLAMCDATPFYHRASGKFLLTGHSVLYGRDDSVLPGIGSRYTMWSVWDDGAGQWSEYRKLEMPPAFFNSGAGSTQIIEEEDGSLLIPACALLDNSEAENQGSIYSSFVMKCSFDGKELKYLCHGNPLKIGTGRGFCEPSLAKVNGRYFLTLRNDASAYVATSKDGLNFTTPIEWTFDGGTPLGSYCTQAHWVTGSTALYLVYTRRTLDNGHVFRNRAPLFIAEIDQDRLCVLSATEQVAVPERGARLGNFGICQNSQEDAYITAAEWMQTNPPDPYDYRVCMKYGSDNSIWLAHVSGLK